jgi:hypothetical protein
MLMQSTIGCAQGCQVCLTFAPSRQELKTGCARSLCKVCNPLVLAPIQYTVAAPKHASHVVSKKGRIMGSRLDPTPPPTAHTRHHHHHRLYCGAPVGDCGPPSVAPHPYSRINSRTDDASGHGSGRSGRSARRLHHFRPGHETPPVPCGLQGRIQ